jgi:hypothetical protein
MAEDRIGAIMQHSIEAIGREGEPQFLYEFKAPCTLAAARPRGARLRSDTVSASHAGVASQCDGGHNAGGIEDLANKCGPAMGRE